MKFSEGFLFSLDGVVVAFFTSSSSILGMHHRWYPQQKVRLSNTSEYSRILLQSDEKKTHEKITLANQRTGKKIYTGPNRRL